MTPLETMRYWIAERESIRIRRFEQCMPPPWTEDEVLLKHRFTNVSRKHDRMTIDLLKSLSKRRTPRDRLLTIVAYRCFNRTTTWDVLDDVVYARKWDEREANRRLKRLSDSGAKTCSGVWMSCGKEGWPIWRSMSRTITESKNIGPKWRFLEDAYNDLMTLPYVGRFLANEMLMDIAYLTPDLDKAPDRTSFVVLGPGSVRGLRRLRGKAPGTGLDQPRPTEDDWLKFQTVVADLKRRPPLKGLELTVHDVEHCLCEYDKYARGLEGGHLKNKFRPKED